MATTLTNGQQQYHPWEVTDQQLVVVPSMSFSKRSIEAISGLNNYEERLLFVLFGLASAKTRLVIATSKPMHPSILDYYFSVLGVANGSGKREEMTSRVQFFHCGAPRGNTSTECLAERLVTKPQLVQQIKAAIQKQEESCDSDEDWLLSPSLQVERLSQEDDEQSLDIPSVCGSEQSSDASRTVCTASSRTSATSASNTTMMVYCVSKDEALLADSLLEVPYCGVKPDLGEEWGGKDGNRRIFRALGIPLADGTYHASMNIDEMAPALIPVVARNPEAKRGLVKLLHAVSGNGNAIVDLEPIQRRFQELRDLKDVALSQYQDDAKLLEVVALALEQMDICSDILTREDYWSEAKETGGAIFEIFIEGCNGESTSPSVQGVINDDGTVSILSTHEQILDDGQLYSGCEFPCRQDYRVELMDYGRQLGEYMALQGIRGHFGADFLCVPREAPDGADTVSEYSIYAMEINVRVTGTTPPFMTLKLLTNGSLDSSTGLFLAPSEANINTNKYHDGYWSSSDDDDGLEVKNSSQPNQNKYYVASDNIKDPSLKLLDPTKLARLMEARPDLHWCGGGRQTGVAFHMISSVSETGKVGMVAIANSLLEARTLFQEATDYVIDAASRIADTC